INKPQEMYYQNIKDSDISSPPEDSQSAEEPSSTTLPPLRLQREALTICPQLHGGVIPDGYGGVNIGHSNQSMQGKGTMDLTVDQETRRRKSVDTEPASPFVSRLSARGDNPIFGTKMGRRQCKSAYNIIKNKTTPESSPQPTPKSDYCNADKAEENDLKKKAS
ncbi:hypothetical protein STEG23_018394, partial [Scotinomys teguina]